MRTMFPGMGVRNLRLMIMEGVDSIGSLAGKTVAAGRVDMLSTRNMLNTSEWRR